MSLASPTSSAVHPTVPRGAELPGKGVDRTLSSPTAVLVLCLVGCGAFVADAVSAEATLALLGLAVLAVALASALRQAQSARVGRPWRTSRLAAATGTAASLFVAALLSVVGVLERMGPQVTSSPLFAAGVAGMSVILLIVLPLALVVFGWAVSRDRRLGLLLRMLPWALVFVLAVTTVTAAAVEGSQELWLEAAAAAVAGALLTVFSAGLPSGGSAPRRGLAQLFGPRLG